MPQVKTTPIPSSFIVCQILARGDRWFSVLEVFIVVVDTYNRSVVFSPSFLSWGKPGLHLAGCLISMTVNASGNPLIDGRSDRMSF